MYQKKNCQGFYLFISDKYFSHVFVYISDKYLSHVYYVSFTNICHIFMYQLLIFVVCVSDKYVSQIFFIFINDECFSHVFFMHQWYFFMYQR